MGLNQQHMMETIKEKVYSPINDLKIKSNISSSPIWDDCYEEEEEMPDVPMYIYHIKFKGLIPIQVTKIEKP